ncbi:uroporphyrinogen-III synthase [Hyphococcus sp.]|uniref:uroporphyrinogen-III synthase n=1 Tax=Hyphococcus sp. TaxID=2038636 RepID=UPI003CCB7746
MKVLITRAEPDASATAAMCRRMQLTPLMAPVMKIHMETAAINLEGVTALAFTSANGVRAFAANAADRSLRVFAVGAVTAEAAKSAGFSAISASAGDVDSLTDHIAAEIDGRPGHLLHIAGKDRAGDLASMLGARNIAAKRVTLYEARAVSALPPEIIRMMKTDPPEWATFFSPRTARLFLSLAEKAGVCEPLGRIRAACLSNAAAQAAGDYWRDVSVSPERTAQSVLTMIAASA